MVKQIFAVSCLLFALLVSPFTLAQQELDTAIAPNTALADQVTVSAMENQQGASTMTASSTRAGGGGGIPAFTMTTNADGSEDYSINLQILALMTMLGFLPAMVILMTSFTRIVVVMSILRQAMGLQQTPSNQVIIGISLFLTFFVMSPVLNQINDRAIQPTLMSKSVLEKHLMKHSSHCAHLCLNRLGSRTLRPSLILQGRGAES
ncbi:flagellar biosynthesis protein FliP [Vibrio astriarenae]|nr:flagellar biosynthesis protein FliP [Vibrio sp. C7]